MGISDNTHSKRTIVSLIKGLRPQIPATVLIVSDEETRSHSFYDIVHEQGCMYLAGASVKGASLYDIYSDFKAASFKNSETQTFLRTVVALIDLSMKYRDVSGWFPKLLLNSIYITDNHSTITYLPYSLIDYLNTFYEDDMRQVLYYPAMIHRTASIKKEKSSRVENEGLLTDELLFSRILARLIYLFLTKNRRMNASGIEQSVYNSRVYYLKTEMNDMPNGLADTLWNIMHGKEMQLAFLRGALVSSMVDETDTERIDKIPFSRRRGIISCKAGISAFFSRRWKLLLIVLILLGIVFYLLSDVMMSRRREDYTAGLAPRQVVELYFSAINTLDLYYLDAIYYKRSGKRVKDELSTVYVMLKMESAFGKTLVHPDEIANTEYDPQVHTVFGIRDLELDQIENDAEPVFRARYTRVISSEESLHETVMEETIQLQFIDDHWYITKSERSIRSEGSHMRENQ